MRRRVYGRHGRQARTTVVKRTSDAEIYACFDDKRGLSRRIDRFIRPLTGPIQWNSGTCTGDSSHLPISLITALMSAMFSDGREEINRPYSPHHPRRENSVEQSGGERVGSVINRLTDRARTFLLLQGKVVCHLNYN